MASRKRPRRRRKPLTRVEKLLRSDGALCVTFVNTATAQRESLDSYDDLLAWGLEVGALAAADADRLTAAAAEHPGKATGVARRACTLRARLHRILVAFATGGTSDGADLEAFNHDLAAVLASRKLVPGAGAYRWSWDGRERGDLDRMLWPVVLSAAELLTSPAVRGLRRCARTGCELLFVARSGGRPRKWCCTACGNRATSSKHYHEKRRQRRR